MNKEDFKILGVMEYGDFPLIEFMINEIVIQDCYGLKNIKEPKTILDIGGNLGVFSIFARNLFPNARIISIEAVYDTYISLKENTKNHNIEVYNMAFGDGSELYLNKCIEHSASNKFDKNKISEISIKSKNIKRNL